MWITRATCLGSGFLRPDRVPTRKALNEEGAQRGRADRREEPTYEEEPAYEVAAPALAPRDELLEDELELDDPELDEPEPEDEELEDEVEAAAGLAEPLSEDELLDSDVFESDLVSEPFVFSALTLPARESLR
jgi:hypothetical protein